MRMKEINMFISNKKEEGLEGRESKRGKKGKKWGIKGGMKSLKMLAVIDVKTQLKGRLSIISAIRQLPPPSPQIESHA